MIGKGPRRFMRRLRRESGASMAEFALILPLLITILFAIFEFGIAFNRAQALEAAAREGGRLASLSSTTNLGQVQARVDATLAGIPLDNPAPATVSAFCAGREGDPVTVTVTTTHLIDIPLVYSNLAVPLSSQAVFRCEA